MSRAKKQRSIDRFLEAAATGRGMAYRFHALEVGVLTVARFPADPMPAAFQKGWQIADNEIRARAT